MRSEQEVNDAVECYSDMILRLCMVYLKNSSDAEIRQLVQMDVLENPCGE